MSDTDAAKQSSEDGRRALRFDQLATGYRHAKMPGAAQHVSEAAGVIDELEAALAAALEENEQYRLLLNEGTLDREAALEEKERLRRALEEVHDYNCGCDTPGRLDRCVAQPVVLFEALSPADSAAQASEEGA